MTKIRSLSKALNKSNSAWGEKCLIAFLVEVFGKPSLREFPVTVCAEMQNGIDLLKAATKQTIWKKHLTFLSAHIRAFYVYLLAMVTAPLLIHEAKGKSLTVPFYRDYWQPGTVVSMRYLKTVTHEYFPSSNPHSSSLQAQKGTNTVMGKPSRQPQYLEQHVAHRAMCPLHILPVVGWAVSPQSCQPLSWARVTGGPLSLKFLGRKRSIAATGYICCMYNCYGMYHCSSSKNAYKVLSLYITARQKAQQSATKTSSFCSTADPVWELSKKQSHK